MEELFVKNKRVCSKCGLDESYKKQWYNHDGLWYCNNCNNKLFKNPKWHSISNKRKFYFKGKFVFAKQNPRVGICSKCDKVGRTELHHKLYDHNNPLAHTIELCSSCHMKQTWMDGARLGRPRKN